MLEQLNHVAVAVPDLNAAINLYRNILGASVSEPVALPEHGVIVAFVTLANTKIELVHPLSDKSSLSRFLERNPSGAIHHLCYNVKNIIAARDDLLAKGVKTIGDGQPKIGAHGLPVLFLQPKDCLGVLIELEESEN